MAVLLLMLNGQATPASGDRSVRAREAMAEERFAEAAALYAELLRADPSNAGLRLNFGIALYSAGEHRRAAAEFETVVKQQPSSGPGWLMLGLARRRLADEAGAIPALEKALAASPGSAEAQLGLASAYLATGRYEQAAERFLDLGRRNPSSAEAWSGLTETYLMEAQRAIEGHAKTDSGTPRHSLLLGDLALACGKPRAAFGLYRRALEGDSGLPGAHAALADTYRATGHDDWAAVEEGREQNAPPPDCASDKLACEFAAARFWQLIAAARPDRSARSLFWQSRAFVELAGMAASRLADLLPAGSATDVMSEACQVRQALPSASRSAIQRLEEQQKIAPPVP